MALRIININNGSEPGDEYIMLKAFSNINLAGYAVVNQTFLTNEGGCNIIYNFPNRRVRKGEYVLLATMAGTDKKYIDIEGDTIHKFHWNSEQCLWNGGNEALLICYQVIAKHDSMIENMDNKAESEK